MEWVPCNSALSAMMREDEKLTGGLGPAGLAVEARLVDMRAKL